MSARYPDVYRKNVNVSFHCERDVTAEALLSLLRPAADSSLPHPEIQQENKRTPRLVHLKFFKTNDASTTLENDVIEALSRMEKDLRDLGLKPFELRIEAVKSIPMFSVWLTPSSVETVSRLGFRLTSSVQVVNVELPVSIIRMLENPEAKRPKGRNEKWRRRRRYYCDVSFLVECKDKTPEFVTGIMRRKPAQVVEHRKDSSQTCFYGFVSSRKTANDAFEELLAALLPSIPRISLLKEHCDVSFSIGLFAGGLKLHNSIRLPTETVNLVSRFGCGLDLSIYL